jgi:hypothetical protein
MTWTFVERNENISKANFSLVLWSEWFKIKNLYIGAFDLFNYLSLKPVKKKKKKISKSFIFHLLIEIILSKIIKNGIWDTMQTFPVLMQVM